jgi:glyoxylase-like metal-dependent hydrolase (beta-lactamase superfamily II)
MPEELEDEFGDIIKKARVGRGLAADIVAHQTSIAVDDIAEMETYRLKPLPEQLAALASVLDLNQDRLKAIADGTWHPDEQLFGRRDGVFVQRVRVPLGAYSSNCYVVGDLKTGEAAVVDPGGAVDDVIEEIERNSLSPSMALITHGHTDHTKGLAQLNAKYPGVTVIVNPEERVHGLNVTHPEGDDEFCIGCLRARAFSTPGHTIGSTCYLVEDTYCFVGDTIFAGSVGGTPAGPSAYQRELESIRNKIFALSDETIILPGHGPATTVGEEKEHNPFF